MKKRKDKLYQKQIPLKLTGGKREVVYSRTQSVLYQKLADYAAEAEAGIPFSEMMELYETYIDERIESKKMAVRTKKGYAPAIKRATEYFEDAPIRLIKPKDISRFLDTMIEEHDMAKKTAATQLLVVNRAYVLAVQRGYADINPCRDIEVPKDLRSELRPIASDDDVNRARESWEAPFGMFYLWAMYTGLRRSEIAALRWEDIDMEKHTVSVLRSADERRKGQENIKSTKTKSGTRTIAIPNALYEKLVPGTGYVFQNENGDMLSDWEIEDRMEKYQEATGVRCTPHQLRKSYATLLDESPINDKMAQYLLGHAQLSTTKNLYTSIRQQRVNSVSQEMLDLDYSHEEKKQPAKRGRKKKSVNNQ